jgi:Beta-lactamase
VQRIRRPQKPLHTASRLSTILVGVLALAGCAQIFPVSLGALAGTGDVSRTALTRDQLFGAEAPSKPVNDAEGFAIPAKAAEPAESFEGVLTLNDLPSSGSFTPLSDVFRLVPEGDSSWKHLPAFSYQFVQSGSYLVPAKQGLAITGSPSWNYILGPGRVWREADDDGYMRASLPFALVQRNQNCVHNGAMTFLFSRTKTPRVSNVYYQITQETCYPMKFDLWGIARATYTPATVPGSVDLKANRRAEILNRIPRKPFATLAAAAPGSAVDLSAFAKSYRRPEDLTTYGVVFNGINYTSGCPTRSGEYAFCDDMPLPSYSIAKSAFAGVALMRLGQLYGPKVYGERVKDHVRQPIIQGNWEATTFNNVSDMASGNYNLPGYEADEDSPATDTFLIEEGRDAKLVDAFAFSQNVASPGTRWVYQSAATYILTQAMNDYLKTRRGPDADIFDLVRDDVFKPLHLSAGALTTIRTDNSPDGAPTGYYGLFLTRDDVAKIGGFLNAGAGVIDGASVLEPRRLKESLFRSENAENVGVPVLGGGVASALGPQKLGSGALAAPNSRRYGHGFWGKHVTPVEFPEYPCDFWVSLMAGYGGNIVAMLPNGATFYVFSDGREFPWVDAAAEIAKLAPMCRP